MLTCKIVKYCMKYLIEKLEEENLECLCVLLTTIGEKIENEETRQLDNIFKKMQEIVDGQSYKISSRVKFMIQDVIALRKRKWVVKSVVDSQPKMMGLIQKKAEQQYRHIKENNFNTTNLEQNNHPGSLSDTKRIMTPKQKITKTNHTTSSVKLEDPPCTKDDLTIFADYIANELRSIKGERNLMVAKKKIIDVIFEVKMDNICELRPETNVCTVITNTNSHSDKVFTPTISTTQIEPSANNTPSTAISEICNHK